MTYVQVTPDFIVDTSAISWFRIVNNLIDDEYSLIIDGELVHLTSNRDVLVCVTKLLKANPLIMIIGEDKSHLSTTITYINKSHVKSIKQDNDKFVYVKFHNRSSVCLKGCKYTLKTIEIELNARIKNPQSDGLYS